MGRSTIFMFLPLFAFVLLLGQNSVRAHNVTVLFNACLPPSFPVYYPGSANYAELSTLNFRTDLSRPPLAIVQARDEADVSIAVRCASCAGTTVCTRSGGHSLAGYSLCSGVLIDVGELRQVTFHGRYKVSLGTGLTMGEALWHIWKQRRRWISAGVCPGVGLGGYILGGGHGPYEGRQSIACDSVLAYRMVDRHGEVVVANARGKNTDLFWALCGAGGGQFGIVTQFRMKTRHSKPIDTAIVFRFTWPRANAGELLSKYMGRYDEHGGEVWFRIEIRLGQETVTGYGACYKVLSGDPQDCVRKLEEADFFNVDGRQTEALFRTKNAADTHAFFGPDGNWSRKLADDPKAALTEKRYVDREAANGRIYKSTFLKFNVSAPPPPEFWQRFADLCAESGVDSLPWSTCEASNFQNDIKTPRENAFPYRHADVIQHYIVGGGTDLDKRTVYTQMKDHLQPYTIGVYVNYPELELSNDDYPHLYWGTSLDRLKEVKKKYNPDNFFYHSQPIPA